MDTKRKLIDPAKFRKRLQRGTENTKHHYSIAKSIRGLVLPKHASVKHFVQSVYDQGQIGSCTANSFCGAYKLLSFKLGKNFGFEPSRLFFYWTERNLELQPGDVMSDSGADVVDGEKYAITNGICSEALWPYHTNNVDVRPSVAAFAQSAQHKIKGYTLIPIDTHLVNNIKATISGGSPVCCAVEVYASFQSASTAKTGMVQIPTPKTWGDQNDPVDALDGGHEMLIVGYNDDTKLFTVLNSWGSGWGHGGYCYIPYDYFTNPNLGSEFTVITV